MSTRRDGRESSAPPSGPRLARSASFALSTAGTPEHRSVALTVLRRSLVSAEEWGYIDHIPSFKWLKTEEPDFDFLVKEESSRLVKAVPSEHRALVETALNTGMRIGELMALKWEHLDLVAGTVRVRRAVWKGKEGAPKSGRSRDIPLNDRLLGILKAHRHLRGPYVFCHESGAPFTRDSLKRLLPAACRKGGLRKVQWHTLRHSFASQLVMAGVPLKAVQELLGHSDIRMTMRYAHLAHSALKEAVEMLDGDGAKRRQGDAARGG